MATAFHTTFPSASIASLWVEPTVRPPLQELPRIFISSSPVHHRLRGSMYQRR